MSEATGPAIDGYWAVSSQVGGGARDEASEEFGELFEFVVGPAVLEEGACLAGEGLLGFAEAFASRSAEYDEGDSGVAAAGLPREHAGLLHRSNHACDGRGAHVHSFGEVDAG